MPLRLNPAGLRTVLACGVIAGIGGCAAAPTPTPREIIAARADAPITAGPRLTGAASQGGMGYWSDPQYIAAVAADDAVIVDADEDGNDLHPGRFFIGVRAGVNAGDGEPANDMPNFGVYGRYRLSGPWLIGVAVDSSTFDFEQPGNLIDVNPVGVVDAEITATSVTAWGEYEFEPIGEDGFLRRLRPFVGAGVGFASLDDDDLSGATEGGGAYAFDISGGTEIIPGAVAGLRYDITRNVVVELGARVDYHLTELEITDNLSGNSAEVDDYVTYGGYLGLQFRW